MADIKDHVEKCNINARGRRFQYDVFKVRVRVRV
jgi:hypothetical protein